MKTTLKIKHTDGVAIVLVTGNLINGTFTGEYKYLGMTYGVNITYPPKPAEPCKP